MFSDFNRVALAVSGGKDSMTLLYYFAREFCHDFFYVINVEHGIRGAESVADSDFVEQYARELGVEVKRFDVDAIGYSREHGYTLEQGARLLRREIFSREVASGACDRVVVAHHLDDNVESVLMHIFRGSGMRGLRGMDEDDGTLLRPLLGVSRAEIDEAVERYHIPYREDSTNSDNAYMRNFVRHDIMPLLRSRYPSVDNAIMRLTASAREDDDYLDSLAEHYIAHDRDRVLIDITAPSVLMKRALYRAFVELGVVADIEERHYSLLLEMRERASGTMLDMPYGVRAIVEYGYIALFKVRERVASEPCVLHEGENIIGEYAIDVSLFEGEPHYTERDEAGMRVLYVDADKVDGATIREREAGDMFERYRGGNKRLKDYFIDIKLPRESRDIPLIVRGSEVLVIAGVELSNDVSISGNTERIYKIKLRRQKI